jgi:hypothetical protein
LLGIRDMNLRFWIVPTAMMFSAACGSGSGHPIDSAGGTITADNGAVTLVFLSGALRSRTNIDVRRIEAAGLSPAYALEPEGLEFETPVRITIATHAPIDATHARIAKLKDDGSFELDGPPSIDTSAQTISASIAGFSAHGVSFTLCPNGCPDQATDLTATAEPDGRIHLAWRTGGGRGGVERFYIERAEYPGLAGSADITGFKFLAWAPGDTATFDDANICKLWTYRYRVRSFAVNTLDDALSAPTAMALSPSQISCATTPPPDAGMAPPNTAAPGAEGTRGTAKLSNFYSRPLSLVVQGASQSPTDLLAHNGSRLVAVDPTIGATTTFELIEDGNMIGMISCTVGQWAWPDGAVGPEVVVQPTKMLSCLDW